MADQSARAHSFDRRMRWFRLGRSLRDTGPAPDDENAPDPVDPGDPGDAVDLREAPVTLGGEPAPVAPSAPSPRLPRQRD